MITEIKSIRMAELNTETTDANWKGIYKIGGAAALLAALAALLDVIISIPLENTIPEPGTGSVVDWFTLFQNNWFLGLYGLGLLNIIYTAMLIPVFLALHAALRRVNQAYATLAIVLLFIGSTIYINNNAAFSMLNLSSHYTAATSEAQKSLLATTGQMLLAQAEDFTPNSFKGFFFSEAGCILMALIMLQSQVFNKLTTWLGFLGFALLAIFTTWATFVPVFYDAAVIVGTVGGFLSMLWFILVAHKLFQLGQIIR
jgi:hypothetical protein